MILRVRILLLVSSAANSPSFGSLFRLFWELYNVEEDVKKETAAIQRKVYGWDNNFKKYWVWLERLEVWMIFKPILRSTLRSTIFRHNILSNSWIICRAQNFYSLIVIHYNILFTIILLKSLGSLIYSLKKSRLNDPILSGI